MFQFCTKIDVFSFRMRKLGITGSVTPIFVSNFYIQHDFCRCYTIERENKTKSIRISTQQYQTVINVFLDQLVQEIRKKSTTFFF